MAIPSSEMVRPAIPAIIMASWLRRPWRVFMVAVEKYFSSEATQPRDMIFREDLMKAEMGDWQVEGGGQEPKFNVSYANPSMSRWSGS